MSRSAGLSRAPRNVRRGRSRHRERNDERRAPFSQNPRCLLFGCRVMLLSRRSIRGCCRCYCTSYVAVVVVVGRLASEPCNSRGLSWPGGGRGTGLRRIRVDELLFFKNKNKKRRKNKKLEAATAAAQVQRRSSCRHVSRDPSRPRNLRCRTAYGHPTLQCMSASSAVALLHARRVVCVSAPRASAAVDDRVAHGSPRFVKARWPQNHPRMNCQNGRVSLYRVL